MTADDTHDKIERAERITRVEASFDAHQAACEAAQKRTHDLMEKVIAKMESLHKDFIHLRESMAYHRGAMWVIGLMMAGVLAALWKVYSMLSG